MNDSPTSLSVGREIPSTPTKGEHMYDRGSSQLADRMGEGTFFGQGVGVIEKETQPSCTRVLRVPPPGGTPGTGTDVCGKWVVAWWVDEAGAWLMSVHETLPEAMQHYRLLKMHHPARLLYMLNETP